MKKFLSIVLTLALLITLTACLSGCEKEQKPLRVVVDLSSYTTDPPEVIMEEFQNYVESHGGPTDVEYEFIPAVDTAERSIALTRIRTEVMAGQGPDVYIVHAQTGNDRSGEMENESLFLFPEKALKNGLFMPLDDYIENAQFMEWDALIPQVMAAGHTENWGQMLLPLGYSFPVTVFDKTKVEHTSSASITWQDMLADESGVMQAAADLAMLHGPYWLGSETFGLLADYEHSQLLFTEEELLQRIREYLALTDNYTTGTYDALPEFFKNQRLTLYLEHSSDAIYGEHLANDEFYSWDDFSMYSDFLTANEIDLTGDKPITMIPVYNDDGGFTVEVDVFTAINANTKRPDDAFFLVDLLLSREAQKNYKLFKNIFESELPVHKELGSAFTPAAGGNSSLYPAAFETYTDLWESITHVKLDNTLDMEIGGLFEKCYQIYKGKLNGDIEELVSTTYTRMKRELSE